MIEADIAFHSAIYAASGNPLIAQSARPALGHLRRAMGAVLQQSPQREALWDEHEAIAAAIARRRRRPRRRLIDHHGAAAPARTCGRGWPTSSTDRDPHRRQRMKLTPEQLAQFDRDGYLFFPGHVHAARKRRR